jgi:hypothetical protein
VMRDPFVAAMGDAGRLVGCDCFLAEQRTKFRSQTHRSNIISGLTTSIAVPISNIQEGGESLTHGFIRVDSV